MACLELGLMLRLSADPKEVEEAESYLTRATTKYQHYLNETMVHIRAYNALADIKDKRRQKLDKDLGRRRTSSIASMLSHLSLSRSRHSSGASRRSSADSRRLSVDSRGASPDSRRSSQDGNHLSIGANRSGRHNSTGSAISYDEHDEFVDCPEA